MDYSDITELAEDTESNKYDGEVSVNGLPEIKSEFAVHLLYKWNA